MPLPRFAVDLQKYARCAVWAACACRKSTVMVPGAILKTMRCCIRWHHWPHPVSAERSLPGSCLGFTHPMGDFSFARVDICLCIVKFAFVDVRKSGLLWICNRMSSVLSGLLVHARRPHWLHKKALDTSARDGASTCASVLNSGMQAWPMRPGSDQLRSKDAKEAVALKVTF